MSRSVLAILSILWLTISPAVPTPEFVLSEFPSLKNYLGKVQRECWWEIKILLESKGKYKYKECKTTFAGKYAYTILWTGCIERDQQDFILYHENSDLIQWEGQERIHSADSKKSQATKKFKGEPGFELHYILRRGKNLHFDFLVKGFDVPQHCSAKKTYLHLPESKGNTDNPTDLDYDLYISKGSNNVEMSRDILNLGSENKEFQWTWQREKSFGSGEGAPYLFHYHDVEVEVSIIRHAENLP
ncbi:hypothetical protein ACFLT2_13105 [Acidobacteriota bacterium]